MRLSVAEAFKFFDDDGDGKLTSAEAIIMVQRSVRVLEDEVLLNEPLRRCAT
jgi:Ca2+-binding EF-hand superfamily protein